MRVLYLEKRIHLLKCVIQLQVPAIYPCKDLTSYIALFSKGVTVRCFVNLVRPSRELRSHKEVKSKVFDELPQKKTRTIATR